MSIWKGSPDIWLQGLLNIREIMIEDLIPKAWDRLCQIGINTTCHENTITNRLVKELCNIKRQILLNASFIIVGQHMVNPANDDTGLIDIAVIYGGDIDLYISYECKWLEKNDAQSLARSYIGSDGLGRYLSGKYAPEMPIGSMIGYVASGDLDKARDRIHRALAKNGLPNPSSTTKAASLHVFTTDHNREPRARFISITHILLPC